MKRESSSDLIVRQMERIGTLEAERAELVAALRSLIEGYRQADEGGDAGDVIGAANDAESLLARLGEA